MEVKRSLITAVLLLVAIGAFCQALAEPMPEWGVAMLEVGSSLEARHEQVALRDQHDDEQQLQDPAERQRVGGERDGPAGERRTADYVNDSPAFFVIHASDGHTTYYVAKAQVATIEELA